MDKKIFQLLCDDAHRGFCDGSVSAMLTAIEGMLAGVNNWDDVQLVQEVRTGYSMMLGYLRDGVIDPEQDKLLSSFVRHLLLIQERTRHAYTLNELNTPQAQAARRVRQYCSSESLDADGLTPRQRFELVWTSGAWKESDTEKLLFYITREDVSSEEKALIVSAATLSVLSYFDPQKVLFLCYMSRDSDEILRMRAQVGIVMSVIVHKSKLHYFPVLTDEIRILAEDDLMCHELLHIQYGLLSASITPDAVRRLHDELEDLTDCEDEEEMKDKMSKKFKVLIGIQEFGADLNIDSFKAMSRASNFFDSTANWFWPFTPEHPELPEHEMPEVLRKLFSLGLHTNTDCYSFLNMTFGHKVKFEMHDDEQTELPLQEISQLVGRKDIAKHYIFDLYRYFSIHHEAEEPNPFKLNIQLIDYSLFAALFNSEEILDNLINIQMQIKDFGHAIPLLTQKLESNPHSVPLLRKLARCYEGQGHYERACHYYAQALELKPDNERLQLSLAYNLVCCHKESEALPILYKLDYHSPNKPEIMRALAWCIMQEEGDFVRAASYFEQLVGTEDEKASDCQNLGHTYLVAGDVASALHCYQRMIELEKPKSITQELLFKDDREWLIKQGVSPTVFALVVDALQ